MGNFYANLALRSTETDRVAAALEANDRTAFVATIDDSTFVYDEACDKQDLDELKRLARIVAKAIGVPVLATVNHDDDVLWMAVADGTEAVEVYNSFPGYFDSGSDRPALSDFDRLVSAFGVSSRSELEQLLRTPHAELTFEIARHQRIMDMLGLNSEAAIFGFRYVSQGELEEAIPSAVIRAVGDVDDDEDALPAGTPVIPSPAMNARSPRTGLTITEAMSALALATVTVPAGTHELFGADRINGLAAFMKLQKHLATRGRIEVRDPADMVARLDGAAAQLLGASEVPLVELTTRLVDALDTWSALSEADRTAIKSGDPSIQRRVTDALMQATRDLP